MKTSLLKYIQVRCLNSTLLEENNVNSRGHTTDFYLGKSDLPRANSSKIARGKFMSGFVLPRQKKSGKITLLISAPKVFKHS